MSKISNVKRKHAIDGDTIIPDNAIEALARMLYPAMVAYFESEEGRREFGEWKDQKDRKERKEQLISVESERGSLSARAKVAKTERSAMPTNVGKSDKKSERIA